MAKIQFTVRLNGTNENPFHRLGLIQNPFPQVAKSEYAPHLLHLARLGGVCIPDTDYIRRHLQGWSEEFVEGCCRRFRRGEMVEFDAYFEE
jgi:hypothetical protein